jgi:hypothetical protein
MKKLKNIGLILGVSVMSLSSCKKDFLELLPYNQIALDVAITNESDMQTALNGAYASLRDADLFGRTLLLDGDLMADNVAIAVNNSNRYLGDYNYSYTVTFGNALSTWSDAYNTILRVNNIINANVAGTDVSNQLRGEALTLRAIMYFYLVNYFAKPYTVDPNSPGVPIVLQYNPSLRPSRNTVEEVYTRMLTDLTEAFGLMTNTTKNSSYVTKYVARAFQAKVLLFKGDWEGAKTAALDVVNNGGYSLTPAANFAGYWANATPTTTKVETIFEVQNDNVSNTTPANDALPYFYDQTGYGDAFAVDALYNLYAATDVRRQLMQPGTRAGQAINIVTKYPNVNNAAEKDDYKILRYADVLLILAEAYARTSDEPNARIRLNQVAQQRDPSFAGYSSSGAALIDDIILERRKELAFEGQRYLDLLRLNRDVVRINLNGNYGGTVPLLLEANNPKRQWPIPQSERDANPNMVQNPGYL